MVHPQRLSTSVLDICQIETLNRPVRATAAPANTMQWPLDALMHIYEVEPRLQLEDVRIMRDHVALTSSTISSSSGQNRIIGCGQTSEDATCETLPVAQAVKQENTIYMH